MPGKCQGYNIGTLTPDGEIFCSVGRGTVSVGKSTVVTISLPPRGGAYTRAQKSEKSLCPPISVCGVAVDTNDCCISYK